MVSRLKKSLINTKQFWLETLLCILLPIVVVLTFTFVSSIPWKFIYLEFGKLVPYSFDWILAWLNIPVLLLFAVPTVILGILAYLKLKTRRKLWRALGALALSLVVSFSIIFLCSLIFMPQVASVESKIDTFVARNSGLSFENYVKEINSFLENNLNQSYDRPEANLLIDRSLTFLDRYLMQIWNVSNVDVILYQGWGSCGEAAFVTGELLQRAGYETRQAFSIGVDHQWTEVNYNGTWLVVDPWYMTENGTLWEARYVRNFNSDFQTASGVRVQYYNGTQADASKEHGY
jgi:hypothetical protein